MKINEATEIDYPELIEFWNHNAGWDQIDRETWERRFIRTPFGASVFVVAREEGRIIAQLIFIRLQIQLGDTAVTGCRPFAAIADSTVKQLAGLKMMMQLYQKGARIMGEKGCALLVMLPDPRWRYLSRLAGVEGIRFPLFKRILNPVIESLHPVVIVKNIDFDHPDIDILWQDVKAQKLYMIARNKELLKWKNSHRDYRIIGVFKNEKLIGIGTYLEKAKEKQIQVCDVLYSQEEVKKQVLDQVSEYLDQAYARDDRFTKMVILVTAALKDSLLEIGYEEDDYAFLFVIKRLSKDLPKKALNISNWYVAAND